VPDHALLLVQDEILLKSIDLLRLADFERSQFLMIAVEILHKVKFHNLQDELILEVHKDYSLTPNLDLVVARNLQIQMLTARYHIKLLQKSYFLLEQEAIASVKRSEQNQQLQIKKALSELLERSQAVKIGEPEVSYTSSERSEQYDSTLSIVPYPFGKRRLAPGSRIWALICKKMILNLVRKRYL